MMASPKIRDTKVCVIGIWHLGSVMSASLSDLGYRVTGMDKDPERVRQLNQALPPVVEPDLVALMQRQLKSEHLRYTTDLHAAVEGAEFVVMAIDTPLNENDQADVSEIFDICREFKDALEPGVVLIVSSQVPVGTCDLLRSVIADQNPSLDFDVACVPENLRLGRALEDFRSPARIVVGTDNDETKVKMEAFFSVIDAPKLMMDVRSAEMSKHALNAFLATSISFTNEIASLCEVLGVDALSVVSALQSDPRIGPRLPLKPGLGFSGGTLGRDVTVLQRLGASYGVETPLINGVLAANKSHNTIVERMLKRVYGDLRGLKVGVLGLTYKSGTSTMRRSAPMEIVSLLLDQGVHIEAYDPLASREEIPRMEGFSLCGGPYEAAESADALVFLTDWQEFRSLDFDVVKTAMKSPVIVDAQNMLDKDNLVAQGYVYLGVGRGQYDG